MQRRRRKGRDNKCTNAEETKIQAGKADAVALLGGFGVLQVRAMGGENGGMLRWCGGRCGVQALPVQCESCPGVYLPRCPLPAARCLRRCLYLATFAPSTMPQWHGSRGTDYYGEQLHVRAQGAGSNKGSSFN